MEPGSWVKIRLEMAKVFMHSYDLDTSILSLWLSDGYDYLITDPNHASRVRQKMAAGMELTPEQMNFLEQYRIPKTEKSKNMASTKETLKKISAEIKLRKKER